MITLRQITCCILSALLAASCALTGTEAPSRIVRIKALADPSLRERNPAWVEEVRGLVESASDTFEREFGIRFITQSTASWPEKERIASTAGLLVRLKEDFPVKNKREPYDLVIAFTAERVNVYAGGKARVDRIGNCEQGLGNYVVSAVSDKFRYSGPDADPELDVVALIHELGHIFGAEHTRETGSIMHENFEYRTEFDAKSRAVILKNKFCPFGKE